MSGPARTDLEKCMELLIKTFHEHAGTDSNSSTLSRDELTNLVKTQLPRFVPKDKECEQKFLDFVDCSGDGEVDFLEYVTALACLTALYHGAFTKCGQKRSSK
ncbi:protein S100-P-like [Hemiscyllium ocellatum]|uniref:protein S100-P-like n=1 Tax=Hemiscyllium ocellatum TaxID=170820 RepID=UPI0029675914|nr:protein S100-P-like [Hemiscyllium ocellatum]